MSNPDVAHRTPEPRGVRPEPVAQLGEPLHEVDRLQARGGNRRGDAVREEIRPRALAEQLDDLASAGDVPTRRATHRLAERSRDDVDALADAVELGRASAAWPDEADGVRVVDHHERVVTLGEIADPRDIGDVAVHREHAVGCDHPGMRAGRLDEPRLELAEVAVRVPESRGLAEPDPVDDRRVVEGVRDDGIIWSEQRLEEPAVRVEARAEQDRVVGAEKRRQPFLELLVQRLCPADEPHRRHSESPALERVAGRLDDRRVVGEPEIVVGAKVQEPSHAFDLDVCRLG